MISNLMDGVVFVDGDGNVALLNTAAEALLGVKSFMVVGRPLTELSDQGDLLDGVLHDIQGLSDERPSMNRVIEVLHTEQDLLYVRARCARITDCQGKSSGVYCTLQDVTADYKTDQLKNQYLSIVAHELRTPLTGIKTFSTMLVKQALGPLSEQQMRVMESIREQSLRLEHQIDKLINLGHLESEDRYGQDLERFEIHELVTTSLAAFPAVAAEHGIQFHVELSEQDGLIEGDRADLRRAIQAIVENAIKFTPEGGKVEVRVTDVDADHVRFSIRDTGSGIDPRYQRRIFEKFFQVEDPLTRHHGGAGLGLFFARGIIEAHGSELTVESELGKGAHFCFVLPIADRTTNETRAVDATPVETA
ncbi:MAG: PAS domain-containing protein [Planctomycetes bacterium]|nr:PAS domain-containing protein [Planctomycetota bacterium]